MGSPPRMRGTGAVNAVLEGSAGITPADAGNSPSCQDTFEIRKNHPRGCGEQSMKAILAWRRWGSPPRMRGTGGREGRRVHCTGDHPRGCGEQQPLALALANFSGSPPRMRGTAASFAASKRCGQDHPRGCGEQSRCHAPGRRVCGSPPRMRGTAPGSSPMSSG